MDEVASLKDMRALSRAKEQGTAVIVGAQLNTLEELQADPIFRATLHPRASDQPQPGTRYVIESPPNLPAVD